MVTIELDEETAAAIARRAAARGLSVPELLRQWAANSTGASHQALSADEFDRMLNQLSGHAPPLPSDFSRADLYRNLE